MSRQTSNDIKPNARRAIKSFDQTFSKVCRRRQVVAGWVSMFVKVFFSPSCRGSPGADRTGRALCLFGPVPAAEQTVPSPVYNTFVEKEDFELSDGLLENPLISQPGNIKIGNLWTCQFLLPQSPSIEDKVPRLLYDKVFPGLCLFHPLLLPMTKHHSRYERF